MWQVNDWLTVLARRTHRPCSDELEALVQVVVSSGHDVTPLVLAACLFVASRPVGVVCFHDLAALDRFVQRQAVPADEDVPQVVNKDDQMAAFLRDGHLAYSLDDFRAACHVLPPPPLRTPPIPRLVASYVF